MQLQPISSTSRLHTQYRLLDGTLVPGVTSIIEKEVPGMALAYSAAKLTKQDIDFKSHWDWLAGIGTLSHHMVFQHLKGGDPDTSQYSQEQIDLAENCFLKFLEWENRHTLDPVLIETPIIHEGLRFGGTPDFYGLIDGVPTILDYKTGADIYPNQWYQMGGYSLLIKEGRVMTERDPSSGKVAKAIILNIGRDESEGFKEACIPSKKHPDLKLHRLYFLTQLRAYQIERKIKKEAKCKRKH